MQEIAHAFCIHFLVQTFFEFLKSRQYALDQKKRSIQPIIIVILAQETKRANLKKPLQQCRQTGTLKQKNKYKIIDIKSIK